MTCSAGCCTSTSELHERIYAPYGQTVPLPTRRCPTPHDPIDDRDRIESRSLLPRRLTVAIS
jgi:hypothetical protein